MVQSDQVTPPQLTVMVTPSRLSMPSPSFHRKIAARLPIARCFIGTSPQSPFIIAPCLRYWYCRPIDQYITPTSAIHHPYLYLISVSVPYLYQHLPPLLLSVPLLSHIYLTTAPSCFSNFPSFIASPPHSMDQIAEVSTLGECRFVVGGTMAGVYRKWKRPSHHASKLP